MITRDILEAQLGLYRQGQMRMMEGLEKAKADAAAMSGAIEACQSLIQILDGLEEAEASADKKKREKPTLKERPKPAKK